MTEQTNGQVDVAEDKSVSVDVAEDKSLERQILALRIEKRNKATSEINEVLKKYNLNLLPVTKIKGAQITYEFSLEEAKQVQRPEKNNVEKDTVNKDRRNDFGQKVAIGLILGGFGTVMGLFINTMLDEATSGKMIALNNRVEIATIKAQYGSIKYDLDEIKSLLRRTSPSERVNK